VLEFLAARVFDGQVVLVSEYARDSSLTEWLRRHGGRAPSIETAVEMTLGILAGSDRSKFGQPKVELRDKRICVTGLIEQHLGIPQIVLHDRSQLKED
jgi:hypothetical protein